GSIPIQCGFRTAHPRVRPGTRPAPAGPCRHDTIFANNRASGKAAKCRSLFAEWQCGPGFWLPARAASGAVSVPEARMRKHSWPPPLRKPALSALVMLDIAKAACFAASAHTQIELTHIRVLGQFFRRTVYHHFPGFHDVAIVCNG